MFKSNKRRTNLKNNFCRRVLLDIKLTLFCDKNSIPLAISLAKAHKSDDERFFEKDPANSL